MRDAIWIFYQGEVKIQLINLMYFEVLAILQNFMGALKIVGSKAKYICDQIYLLINLTYMNRQYSDSQKIIYDPIEILLCLAYLT